MSRGEGRRRRGGMEREGEGRGRGREGGVAPYPAAGSRRPATAASASLRVLSREPLLDRNLATRGLSSFSCPTCGKGISHRLVSSCRQSGCPLPLLAERRSECGCFRRENRGHERDRVATGGRAWVGGWVGGGMGARVALEGGRLKYKRCMGCSLPPQQGPQGTP